MDARFLLEFADVGGTKSIDLLYVDTSYIVLLCIGDHVFKWDVNPKRWGEKTDGQFSIPDSEISDKFACFFATASDPGVFVTFTVTLTELATVEEILAAEGI